MQEEKRIQAPIQGDAFDVIPKTINRKLFKKKRKGKQEQTRRLIVEAFEEVDRNPDKYGKSFKAIIPEKTWTVINLDQAQKIAAQFKGHVADWVEQALVWAQRISNGESWEAICNKPDKAKYYRIVIWKNDHIRMAGGSDKHNYSAADVCDYDFDLDEDFSNVVPLIASQM